MGALSKHNTLESSWRMEKSARTEVITATEADQRNRGKSVTRVVTAESSTFMKQNVSLILKMNELSVCGSQVEINCHYPFNYTLHLLLLFFFLLFARWEWCHSRNKGTRDAWENVPILKQDNHGAVSRESPDQVTGNAKGPQTAKD